MFTKKLMLLGFSITKNFGNTTQFTIKIKTNLTTDICSHCSSRFGIAPMNSTLLLIFDMHILCKAIGLVK